MSAPSPLSCASFASLGGASHDRRAGLLCQLHAAGADAAPRRTEDEHRLSRLDAAAREHHAMRGAVGDRQRRRLREVDRGIELEQHMSRHTHQFGKAAIHGLAQETARDPVGRIDQHPISWREAGDPGPHRRDLARHVVASDQRQRHLDAGHALAGEQVVVVEGAGAHAHQRVARPGHGIAVIGLVDELVQPAVLIQHHRPHGALTRPGAMRVGRWRSVPHRQSGAAGQACWWRQAAPPR